MLPKRQKLNRITFPKYTDPKKTWNGVFFRIQYSFTDTQQFPTFGVVISKKIASLATTRNKLRRMIYNVLSESQNDIAKHRGVKVVIYPLKKDKLATKEDIQRDIHSFLTTL